MFERLDNRELPDRSANERIGGPESAKLWKPSFQRNSEGSIGNRNLNVTITYSSARVANAIVEGKIKVIDDDYLSLKL